MLNTALNMMTVFHDMHDFIHDTTSMVNAVDISTHVVGMGWVYSEWLSYLSVPVYPFDRVPGGVVWARLEWLKSLHPKYADIMIFQTAL